jgi:hypothetical protein
MGKMRNAYIFVTKPGVKRPLEDLSIDGSVLLKWALRK